jgi:hypothetical protein
MVDRSGSNSERVAEVTPNALSLPVLLADSGFNSHLADLGNDPVSMSFADFGKLLAEETEKWAKVFRAANIKAGQRAVP